MNETKGVVDDRAANAQISKSSSVSRYARSRRNLEGPEPQRSIRTLIVQRRMLHYVHMLDMPPVSIESFARLPNDA